MPKSSKKVLSLTRPFKWMKRGRVSKPHPRSYVLKYLKLFRLIIQMSKTSRKGSASEVNSVAPLSKWMKRHGVSETRLLSFLSKHLELFRSIIQILKSSKKGSASEVGLLPPPAVVDHYTKSMKEGKKRVEEEIVEKHVASSKKQKMVDDTGGGGVTPPAVDKNKFDTKNKKKKKSVKKPEIREEEELEPKPSSKKQSTKKRVGSSSDESESSDDTGSSSDDEEEEPKKPVAAPTKNCSYEEEGAKNGYVAVTPAKNKVKLSDGDSSSAEELDERCGLDVDRPSKWYRYLFMGNLSPSIQKEDVLDFFKDAGKIESVFFDHKYGRLAGCGHVRFSTTEAAQKGLKRNKEKLLGHAVELVLATHASVWYSVTPSSTHRRKKGPLCCYIGRGYGPTL